MENGVRRCAHPVVSVVIPVRNGERFLGDAIRSVLQQTYPASECIVVDDGSTDGSVGVARSFGPAVRVIEKGNGGVASARNVGIDAAEGQLLAFLDSDDYWLPHKLERQVRCWQERPWAGMVFTGFGVVKDAAGRPCYRILATEPTQRLRSAVMLEGYGIGFSFTALVTRSAVESVGPFDERLSISADISYAWRLLQDFEVLAIPDALAVYRMHGRSQMHHDLAALEHDRSVVIQASFGAGSPERSRATANLHTHLAYRWLLNGDLGRALHHAGMVMGEEPARLATLPLAALRRRLARRLVGRWPARGSEARRRPPRSLSADGPSIMRVPSSEPSGAGP